MKRLNSIKLGTRLAVVVIAMVSLNFTPKLMAYNVEAEAMTLSGYSNQVSAAASGGQLVSLAGDIGSAQTVVTGIASGFYDLTVNYFDENAGRAGFKVYVGDQLVDAWLADENYGSATVSAQTLTRHLIRRVYLNPGDVIQISGIKDGSEPAPLDRLSIDASPATGTNTDLAWNSDGTLARLILNGTQQLNTNGTSSVNLRVFDGHSISTMNRNLATLPAQGSIVVLSDTDTGLIRFTYRTDAYDHIVVLSLIGMEGVPRNDNSLNIRVTIPYLTALNYQVLDTNIVVSVSGKSLQIDWPYLSGRGWVPGGILALYGQGTAAQNQAALNEINQYYGGIPWFINNPMTNAPATEGIAYAGTLAGTAADSASDNLAYGKVSGPAWLTVAANGALGGTPAAGDIGTNSWTVQVADNHGATNTATLGIYVYSALANQPPAFTNNPITLPAVRVGVVCTDSLAGTATDVNPADILAYSEVSGPGWLTVATNGALGGTPLAANIGVNSWTVRVTDGNGGTNTATLNILVYSATNIEPLHWTGGNGSWAANDYANLIWKDNLGNVAYFGESRTNEAVVFDNTTGSGGVVALNTTVTPASVTVTNTTAYTLSGSGSIAGTGALTKSGSGMLTLAAPNTFSGGVTFSGTTLTAAADHAFGTGPVVETGSGTLTFNTPTNATFPNAMTLIVVNNNAMLNVSPSSTVTLNGNLVLSGANYCTFIGQGNVNAGGFVLGGSNVLTSTRFVVKNTSVTLANNYAANSPSFQRVSLGDSGGSASAVYLADGITYTYSVLDSANVAVNSCTFYVGMQSAGSSTFSGTGASGTAVDLQHMTNSGTGNTWNFVAGTNATCTFSGNITNSGGGAEPITKIGAGTVVFGGTNTYGGTTTIANGLLQGVTGGSCANSSVTVAATSGNTAALGVAITSNTKQWTCASLTVNNNLNGGASSGLQFNFGAVTPSASLAPLNVTGSATFTTAPGITILGSSLPLSAGNGYPLLTWSGAGPATTNGMTLTLPSGTGGNLAIVGKTLYLQVTPVVVPSAALSYSVNGSQLVLNWASGQGWVLQAQTNTLGTGLSTNWVPVAGATPPFTNQVSPANGAVFYRLISP